MGKIKKIFKKLRNINSVFLIFIFALLFSYVVTDGIRIVVQKMYEMPIDYIGLAFWGESFWFRLLAGIVSGAVAGFIIGAHLKRKVTLLSILVGLIKSIFWIFVLWMSFYYGHEIKYKILAILLIILSPIASYMGAQWGREQTDEFDKPKSLFNIKWYHWFWILPFFLNSAIALAIYNLLLVWRIDAFLGDPDMFDFFYNLDVVVARMIFASIFFGIISSIIYIYGLLTSNEKIGFKKTFAIIGIVILFLVLHLLFLNTAPSIENDQYNKDFGIIEFEGGTVMFDSEGEFCYDNLFDCGDFTSQQRAQVIYDECKWNQEVVEESGIQDIHQLDGDGDGFVCESLPTEDNFNYEGTF